MKIAHFSPLPPTRSGVADYCASLLPFLSRHCEVDVWIHVSDKACVVPEGCSVVFYSLEDDLGTRLSSYDTVVYHIGNAPAHLNLYRAFLEFPGAIVLHDVNLHHFFATYYLEYLRSPEL